jgi:hypothetical protein
MKTRILLLVIAVAALALMRPGGAKCEGCGGLQPLKPLIPAGCRDLEAECVCNIGADKCRWVWKCVK